MSGRNSGVLSSITALRKLVNHPKLIYDAMKSQMQGGAGRKDEGAAGFEDCEQVTRAEWHDVRCWRTPVPAFSLRSTFPTAFTESAPPVPR